MKKFTLLLIIAAIIFAITLFGCSQKPVYKLNPEEEIFDYFEGREMVTRDDSIFTTVVNFEAQEKDFFIFYLYAVNNFDETIMFNPERIYLEIVKTQDALEEHLNQKRLYALDPEIQIDMIDKAQKDLETEHSVNTGINIFLAIIDVAEDVASNDNIADDVFRWGNVMHNEETSYEMTSDNLYAQKKYWENEVLRRTALLPGQECSGLIYIPIDYNAGILRLVIPAGKIKHHYLFKQSRVD